MSGIEWECARIGVGVRAKIDRRMTNTLCCLWSAVSTFFAAVKSVSHLHKTGTYDNSKHSDGRVKNADSVTTGTGWVMNAGQMPNRL